MAQTADLDVSVQELTRQQAVPGQTVYLENPAIGYSAQQQTDAFGKAVFQSVPLNRTYRVFTKANDSFLESDANGIVAGKRIPK